MAKIIATLNSTTSYLHPETNLWVTSVKVSASGFPDVSDTFTPVSFESEIPINNDDTNTSINNKINATLKTDFVQRVSEQEIEISPASIPNANVFINKYS